MNHADWDVCVDCGELRPVISLDAQGTVRRAPRRARSRRWLEGPITATMGVGLCFVSGALIAFALRPAAQGRLRSSEAVQAVPVDATATVAAPGATPAWVPMAATPPPVATFQVAPPASPTARPQALPGFQFYRPAESVPPPVGLYAPPTDYAPPALSPRGPAPAAPTPSPQFVTAQQIVARIRGSLLRIDAEAPAADRRGTGFVVGPRLAVTCAHLVQGTSAIAVTLVDGQVFRARVERVDTLNDLALLVTQGDLPPVLPLDPSGRVEPGEPIAVTGFPTDPGSPGGAQDWTVPGNVVGWVTRSSPTGDRVQMLQVTADIRPGHSGGPVYSLRDGRVMGVMSFRVASEGVAGFAAGIPMLQQLISSGESPRDPNSPQDGTP